MATIALLVGGAILNAAAFTGGNYLAKYLSGSDTAPEEMVAERKRHDLALEKFENDTREYNRKRQKYLDGIREREIEKREAMQELSKSDKNIELYARAKKIDEKIKQMEKEKNLLNAPEWRNYYKPNEAQKNGEILFLSIGAISLGIILVYEFDN